MPICAYRLHVPYFGLFCVIELGLRVPYWLVLGVVCLFWSVCVGFILRCGGLFSQFKCMCVIMKYIN